jgi:hypothetical protein
MPAFGRSPFGGRVCRSVIKHAYLLPACPTKALPDVFKPRLTNWRSRKAWRSGRGYAFRACGQRKCDARFSCPEGALGLSPGWRLCATPGINRINAICPVGAPGSNVAAVNPMGASNLAPLQGGTFGTFPGVKTPGGRDRVLAIRGARGRAPSPAKRHARGVGRDTPYLATSLKASGVWIDFPVQILEAALPSGWATAELAR